MCTIGRIKIWNTQSKNQYLKAQTYRPSGHTRAPPYARPVLEDSDQHPRLDPKDAVPSPQQIAQYNVKISKIF